MDTLYSSLEFSQANIDKLNILKTSSDWYTVIKTGDYWEFPLDRLPYKYFHYVSGKVKITTPCSKTVTLKYVRDNQLPAILQDPFNNNPKDSVLFNFGKSSNSNNLSIYLYSATDSIQITYLRYPRYLSLGTYPYVDGIVRPEQSCELPDIWHSEIVDLAVKEASRVSTQQTFQLDADKLTTHIHNN